MEAPETQPLTFDGEEAELELEVEDETETEPLDPLAEILNDLHHDFGQQDAPGPFANTPNGNALWHDAANAIFSRIRERLGIE